MQTHLFEKRIYQTMRLIFAKLLTQITQKKINNRPVSKLYPFNCSFYANYYIDEFQFEGGEDDHQAVFDGLYDAI